MIEFLTVFLGLISGPQQVELGVAGEVARVELRLNGAVAGTLEAPPWKLEIDLGQALQPHRLEAVALDTEGQEVDRAEQILNMAAADASVRLMVESDPGPGLVRRGRVLWRGTGGARPERVHLDLDGVPLEVRAMRAFELPPASNEQSTRILSTTVEFPGGAAAYATLLLGGTLGDEASSDLTHLPLLLQPGAELPPLDSLQLWLESRGQPLAVRAVGGREAEVIVVRDRASWGALTELGRRFRGNEEQAMGRLGNRRNLRLLDAISLAKEPGAVQSFPLSQLFSEGDGGVPWVLGTYHREEFLGRRGRRVRKQQQLADAVAIAGMRVAASHGGRAVVLVLGPSGEDASQWEVRAVRQYLATLAVPLLVWSPATGPNRSRLDPAWGEVRDISTPALLLEAAGELARFLDRQRVLWVEGRHFLHEVRLRPAARSTARLP